MARNLQAKLPPSDTVRLFDINKAAADKLLQEVKDAQAGGAAVDVLGSAADAAREAVRAILHLFSLVATTGCLYDEFVLSMMF
jgi:hypothetical protein